MARDLVNDIFIQSKSNHSGFKCFGKYQDIGIGFKRSCPDHTWRDLCF